MSVVSLQVGQCGNQVGSAFFSTVADQFGGQADSAADELFFRESGRSGGPPVARAVLVDMEAKVIATTLRGAAAASSSSPSTSAAAPSSRVGAMSRRAGSKWQYDMARSFHQQSGSGNNWAAGFHTYAPRFRRRMMDLIRREVEAADHLGGFLLLQSMAGGTGAGVGASLAEAVRDEYASSFLLNHSIWPYASGEVIVQSYNTALSLSHAAECSDGVMLVENEVLHRTCQLQLGIKNPTFQDLNAVAARALAAALLPATLREDAGSTVFGRAGRGVRLLGDLMEHLTSHPSYPILSLYTVPQIPTQSMSFETFNWASSLKRLRQMLVTGSKLEDGMNWSVGCDGGHHVNRSLANYLCLRGQGAAQTCIQEFADPRLYCPWACQPLLAASSARQLGNCPMTACLLSNSQACLEPLCSSLDKAYRMYSTQAFTHQYVQHGMALQDFDCAFSRIEDLICRYQAL
mmetsp:Transcript_16838/g.43137  ORF Transcript_16838/g.43137 Transcript_16838/m.43137 type:complete len:461 (-) Transcript_16838:100-1482(-)